MGQEAAAEVSEGRRAGATAARQTKAAGKSRRRLERRAGMGLLLLKVEGPGGRVPPEVISAGRLRYVHLDTTPAKKVPSAPSKILDPASRQTDERQTTDDVRRRSRRLESQLRRPTS